MKYQPKPPPKSYPHVYVDVFPWVKFIAENIRSPRIPINGIFRHADIFCKYFTPAMALLPDDRIDLRAVDRLEDYLGKKMRIVESKDRSDSGYLASLLNSIGCTHWISIGPDCSGPATWSKEREYQTVAILHDIFAAEGTYMALNQELYRRSVGNTDVFLSISDYAMTSFLEWVKKKKLPFKGRFIRYGAPHRFYRIPKHTGDFHLSLSLSTIWKHKNLLGVSQLARHRDIPHYHIGMFGDATEDTIVRAITQEVFKFTGELADKSINYFMARAGTFMCLSFKEGFSMPPMEAIIAGVPQIILSDIPVHREIYEGSGAVFINPFKPVESFKRIAGNLPTISSQVRESYFERYKAETVMSDLFSYLEGAL